MKPPTISLTALLERIEGELPTPDGRTVRVCRDTSGKYWVVDCGERVVPFCEFAAGCGAEARVCRDRARAEALLRRARVVARAFARAPERLQRMGARVTPA